MSNDSAKLAVKLLKNGTLQTIAGGSHGLCTTSKDEINKALLMFANA